MPTATSLSRRTFVAGATAAAAARQALTAKSAARIVGANERLHVGMIGAGGNANGHMRALKRLAEPDNVEIAAVCDIYDPRREAAAEFTGGQPFKDYRRLLEHSGLDYVTISVPEHWHAPITLDAADAGLHVYVEKPLTYSIEEGPGGSEKGAQHRDRPAMRHPGHVRRLLRNRRRAGQARGDR